jgi:hypothetical protein
METSGGTCVPGYSDIFIHCELSENAQISTGQWSSWTYTDKNIKPGSPCSPQQKFRQKVRKCQGHALFGVDLLFCNGPSFKVNNSNYVKRLNFNENFLLFNLSNYYVISLKIYPLNYILKSIIKHLKYLSDLQFNRNYGSIVNCIKSEMYKFEILNIDRRKQEF